MVYSYWIVSTCFWIVIIFKVFNGHLIILLRPFFISFFNLCFHIIQCFFEHSSELLTHGINVSSEITDCCISVFFNFFYIILKILFLGCHFFYPICIFKFLLFKSIYLIRQICFNTFILSSHIRNNFHLLFPFIIHHCF